MPVPIVTVVTVPTIVTATAPGPQGAPGPVGPPGAPGPSGAVAGQVRVVAVAAVAVSGHRLVTPDVNGELVYASNTVPGHVHAPLWLTLAAAAAGDPVETLIVGAYVEPTWSWTPGPLYLGVDGLLTQTAPTAASGAVFLAPVGYATSPTAVVVDRAPSIALT